MQCLEVSGAVRPIYESLGVKRFVAWQQISVSYMVISGHSNQENSKLKLQALLKGQMISHSPYKLDINKIFQNEIIKNKI